MQPPKEKGEASASKPAPSPRPEALPQARPQEEGGSRGPKYKVGRVWVVLLDQGEWQIFEVKEEAAGGPPPGKETRGCGSQRKHVDAVPRGRG